MCSPFNSERELGLDRRKTGWFYHFGVAKIDGSRVKYERNNSAVLKVEESAEQQELRRFERLLF